LDLPPGDTSEVSALQLAFMYVVDETATEGGKPRLTVQPCLCGADGEEHPPAPRSLPFEVHQVWEDAADRAQSDFVRARLRHLLFGARHGNGRQQAQAASDAYLAWAGQLGTPGDQIRAMRRAYRLARAVGDQERMDAALERLSASAQAALDDGDDVPGWFLLSVQPLVEAHHPAAQHLLVAGRARYTSPLIVHQILDLQQSLGLDAEPLRRQHVEVDLQAASDSEGLLRQHHLSSALSKARQYGLVDLAEVAAQRLQAVNLDELKLQRIRASAVVSQSEMDVVLAPFRNARSFDDALLTFISLRPLTGIDSENRELTEQLIIEFPLRWIFDGHRLDAAGQPRVSRGGMDSTFDVALAETEVGNLQTRGAFWATSVLLEIRTLFPFPTEQDVAETVSQLPVIQMELAGAFARALRRFWIGDYEAVVFTIVPRLETLARDAARGMGLPTFAPEEGQRPGQDAGLAQLLELLAQSGLDPSTHRYICTLATNPWGPELRTLVAHGQLSNADSAHAAIALHAFLYLAASLTSLTYHRAGGPPPGDDERA
jgi:hypothetical protein